MKIVQRRTYLVAVDCFSAAKEAAPVSGCWFVSPEASLLEVLAGK